MIFLPPLLSQDAVRPWTCVASSTAAAARGDAAQAAFDPLQERNRITRTTEHSLPLVWTADGRRIPPSLERFSTRQTSLPVGVGSFCRRSPFIADGSTKSKSLSCGGGQPWLARFSQTPLRGRSDSSQASSTEPCIAGDMPQPLTGGLGCTTLTSTAPTLTHFQMTMTTSCPWSFPQESV